MSAEDEKAAEEYAIKELSKARGYTHRELQVLNLWITDSYKAGIAHQKAKEKEMLRRFADHYVHPREFPLLESEVFDMVDEFLEQEATDDQA